MGEICSSVGNKFMRLQRNMWKIRLYTYIAYTVRLYVNI